jgi:hypothetical protein
MLIDVFTSPQRFRFNSIGQEISASLDSNITGKFVDEVGSHRPFEFFIAQVSVTVEARSPTFYRREPISGKGRDSLGYSRLMLPTWGNGRIDMLIAAVV